MGDFNQDILQKQSTVAQHMNNNGYRQIVKRATTEKGTLIDHVYVRGHLPVTAAIMPTFFSYHEAIQVIL